MQIKRIAHPAQHPMIILISLVLTLLLACGSAPLWAADDPLPSWHDTAPKKAIVAFVERVTTPGSPDFVPVPERIATFDNDGTLWAEQPMYVQGLFLIDRVKALAPHPGSFSSHFYPPFVKGGMEPIHRKLNDPGRTIPSGTHKNRSLHCLRVTCTASPPAAKKA